MTAYYNENDPVAAQWLRNLISEGLIAHGEVDERDIREVRSKDVKGFSQAHFFAGIGGWSLALRLAGWPDERPVWTGSCPCQPFSLAGKRSGSADERHLWPVWSRLVGECRPPIVFGEQVAAAIGHGWLDAVFADLEGEDYACGAAVLPACGVGAPHIRQRLWFVAHCEVDGRGEGRARASRRAEGAGAQGAGLRSADDSRRSVAYHHHNGRGTVGLADRNRAGLEVGREQQAWRQREAAERGGAAGAWGACDWTPCRDGKSRPVEPGTFPLAHGIPARVGRLRAYGNAIVPQVAAEVIAAFMECRP